MEKVIITSIKFYLIYYQVWLDRRTRTGVPILPQQAAAFRTRGDERQTSALRVRWGFGVSNPLSPGSQDIHRELEK